MACSDSTSIDATAPPRSAPPIADRTTSLGMPVDAEHYEVLGAGVAIGPALAVGDVLADPAAYAGRALRVEGEVLRVDSDPVHSIAVGTERAHLLVRFTPALTVAPVVAPGGVIVCEGELADPRGATSTSELAFVATGAAIRK